MTGEPDTTSCESQSRHPETSTSQIPETESGSGTRGVSYALGFLLVFSVFIAGTFALFVVGVDVLADVDREETATATHENLKVVHSEVGDATVQGTDREMTLELVETQVGLDDRDLTLHIESAGLGVTRTYETAALQFSLQEDGTTFAYAFGHGYRVERGDRTGALSEEPPVFDVSGEQVRLVVPTLSGTVEESPTEIGVGGTGERTITARYAGGESFTRTAVQGGAVGSATGTVTVSGVDHHDVWVDAFERTGFETVTRAGNSVTGEFETERLTVEQAAIDFDFGGE